MVVLDQKWKLNKCNVLSTSFLYYMYVIYHMYIAIFPLLGLTTLTIYDNFKLLEFYTIYVLLIQRIRKIKGVLECMFWIREQWKARAKLLFFFLLLPRVKLLAKHFLSYFVSRVYLQNSEIHLNFIVYVEQHTLQYKMLVASYEIEGGRARDGVRAGSIWWR